jgi:membrane protein DedA with SNARE-associated domain
MVMDIINLLAAATEPATASAGHGVTGLLKDWAVAGMQSGGYQVAALLMALESMIAPVPSEVVMPPLGMLIHQKPEEFGFPAAIVWTSLGSLVGSLISYYLGYFGGKPLVMKVGKWFLLNEHHLDLTTRWFGRWGSLTVFVCRFVPVVRHFISIPAGIARMKLWKFCLYTLVGATIWNSFLMWLGYKLESHWETILKYRQPIDVGVIGLLIVGVVLWYWLNLRKPRHAEASVEKGAIKQ